ncbi:hypothetical protein W97_01019 [Coniosporium apollinis CBS 100218]|uniref:Uncharacterized protein n=1 Tax=Coniosporium apollinis (strain CBS 100218) TaxID=1168221 RepID=R7YIQ3_CONA1|nr:uncharacterized protein W97_01019 [Coniosporium apollinis CBS 100218]EON61802.1 hypothetical protein W97_01019 [Coniosporium apollinis CBS 100218]
MVILNREPNNPYDGNAIQVQNVRREQIGHIPRQVAAKLAKYMDSRDLVVEGFIAGEKEYYDCPISLKLYGTSELVGRMELANKMKSDKLPLEELKAREKAEKARIKEAALAAKRAKKGVASVGAGQRPVAENENPQWAAGLSQGDGMGPTMDDLISGSERFNPRNVEQMVEQFGTKEEDLANMPMAEQPEALAAKLLPFQLQGLKWMLVQESPRLPPVGSKEAVQLWTRSVKEVNTFINLATSFTQKNEPELASGGILADDMGLGKTVQVISLMMADRALKKERSPGVSGATLILAPLSVMSNWSSQIKRHIQENSALRVMIYHGTRKQPVNPQEIDKYDVVIATYETVSSEYWSKNPDGKKEVNHGLFSVKWRRVVLDKGHNIRNPTAKRSVAAMHLEAQSRWALTGTPIVNTLKDLYSLVKFLRLTGGIERFEVFHGAITRPVNQGDERGNWLLQLLMRSICLRRKKEMSFIDLRLPELSEYVHRINFLPHEKEKYDALEAEAKGTLDTYRAEQGSSGANAAKAYRHLLEILLRLRQMCNHWKLCGEERFTALTALLEKQKTVDLTPENKASLQQLLQLSIESQDDCPVCLDNLKDPVITCCAHVFCHACIEQVIEHQHKCPLCRAEIESTAALVRPAKEIPDSAASAPVDAKDGDGDGDEGTSSKIHALLSILRASRKQNKGNKTVVFSQWTSFLDIIQQHLDDEGVGYTRIDGTMPAARRDEAMERLEQDPGCEILLASLGVCSVALNLVAANQVVLMDSWWAPAIEDQAIDRVHRLGQTKPTTVFRLVMEGSIEETVLRIQQDKRKLMMLAFAEKDGAAEGGAAGRRGRGNARGARLADIERLLGGAGSEGER